eukprot:CAMPEP_0114508438 /NCGR_PEP_ID=MMETSP0109-20121206/12600_1 /TAXON_ID=29199 /ORGANISM="Chlorarachnion reptans, Strain CCCM449" /LENGTH=290 /DNA_ID=CAMNT_0001687371 /DNA_START=488 /DNA_END=1360 /DNA_ORIENTATION=-
MTRKMIEVGRAESLRLKTALLQTQHELEVSRQKGSSYTNRLHQMKNILDRQVQTSQYLVELQKNRMISLQKGIAELQSITDELIRLNSSISENRLPGEKRNSKSVRFLEDETTKKMLKRFMRVRWEVDETVMLLQKTRADILRQRERDRRIQIHASKNIEIQKNETISLQKQINATLHRKYNASRDHNSTLEAIETEIQRIQKRLSKLGLDLNKIVEKEDKGKDCEDDPFGQLKSAGVTCPQIAESYGCDFDLSSISDAPKGFVLSKLCPHTCAACDQAPKSKIDLNGGT